MTFTAICTIEGGEPYSELMTIMKTSTGVTINSDDGAVAWTTCPSASQSAPAAPRVKDKWVFADGVASILTNGNYLEFSCIPAGASFTFPTARMYACSLCLMGDEIDFAFSVDGATPEIFTFTKQSNADGMTSDLYNYQLWY